jgi:Delta carbonic anhydrase
MNLCNIHFHKNAEHKGGEFTTFAGHGDGHGYQTGYKYSGKLSASESRPLDAEVCDSKHGGLQVGDTVELHYVHSSAQVVPGPTLGACLSESDSNPQLRVEAQVFVLVNDDKAVDFNELTKVGEVGGYHQALHIPKNAGKPIQYAGSTTGPAYNEKGSPLQVSWSVRPRVLKVNATSVGQWCKGNAFNEDHAHGVRNLVVNDKLLSTIK